MVKQNQKDTGPEQKEDPIGEQQQKNSRLLGQKELKAFKRDPQLLYEEIQARKIRYSRITAMRPKYLILGVDLYPIFLRYLQDVAGINARQLSKKAIHQYFCDDMYVLQINKIGYLDVGG